MIGFKNMVAFGKRHGRGNNPQDWFPTHYNKNSGSSLASIQRKIKEVPEILAGIPSLHQTEWLAPCLPPFSAAMAAAQMAPKRKEGKSEKKEESKIHLYKRILSK